ncbi:MAG: DUF4979 domain-containing protein [Clostridium sp.]|nr:DUF4979 domain-containing protein [Clostridium sp.]
MIKHLLTFAAAASIALSASAELNFTFGTSLDGWNFGSDPKLENGHVVVDLAVQSNGEFRQDFKHTGSNVTIDPATEKVFAFKFIGEMPKANYSFNLKGGDVKVEKPNFRKNDNTANTLSTIGGNYVLYVDLSNNEAYTSAASFTPSTFEMKVADVAADAEVLSYTIDWIKSFESMDALKASMNAADDENDQDEANAPVVNTTTGTPYGSLTAAIDAASAGDEIIIKQDQVVSGRYGITKAITVSGATGNEVITESSNNTTFFLVSNSKYGEINFKNLIISGSGKTTNKHIFEIQNGGNIVTFENVTFKDITLSKANAIKQTNGGKTVFKNVKFENIAFAEDMPAIFLGNNCQTTLSGEIQNASVYLQKTNSVIKVAAGGITGTPIPLTLEDARSAGAKMVEGTTNVEMFTITNEGFSLLADEANNNIILAEATDGIESIDADLDAPVEYFNMQGVKVAEPTPGLYIMRQGSKTAKVLIK